jgi:hypothetical protein
MKFCDSWVGLVFPFLGRGYSGTVEVEAPRHEDIWGIGDMSSFIPNLATRWRLFQLHAPAALLPWKAPPPPIPEAGWAPVSVGTRVVKKKILSPAPAGNRTPAVKP